MLLTLILLLLVAVALLVIGYRGTRVDDHPICRKCRYDLFNRPPDSTRCPECGSDITHPSAMGIGQRQLGALKYRFIA